MQDPATPALVTQSAVATDAGPGRVLWLRKLAALAAVAVLIVCPLALVTVVSLNLVVSLCVLGLQAVLSCLPRKPAAEVAARSGREPFVSIHVPAHNEPPEILIETLRSLARIDWPHYEVLVIDNNTTDATLWQPVARACEELGARFRFLHIEGLAGFKAGAMNWARGQIDARAEFVFVVDADYQVTRDCLRRAFAHVTDDGVAVVQFPQHYRNVTQENAGLALEFRHFFASYMHFANRLDCVPSTGTLTLIRLDALRAVGGFDTEVITEDAALGLRLIKRGYRAVYADEDAGKGLMPHDMAGLKKQRWRWAFGNAQVIRASWRDLAFGSQLAWRQKLGFFAHMTAWFNFNLIPSLSLIVLSIVAVVGKLGPAQHVTIYLSAATLLAFLALRFVTLAVGLRRDGHSRRDILRAYSTHLGLGWIFSLSWLSCFWNHRSPFVRTNKFITEVIPGRFRWMVTELAVGSCLLAAAATLALTDLVAGPAAAFVFGGVRLGILWVGHQAVATYELTARQLAAAVVPDSGEDLELRA